jgi:hypothetical protein
LCALWDVVRLQRQLGRQCCVDAAARPKQNTRLGYTKDALLRLEHEGVSKKSADVGVRGTAANVNGRCVCVWDVYNDEMDVNSAGPR